MYPSRFAYQRASTLEEALDLMAGTGEDIKILAGGQSLIPLMKLRLAVPARLLDISRLHELRGIRTDDGLLRIGALTCHADLEQLTTPAGLELLREGARVIGDPQVRNLGTVGGALAEVDPAGDWGAILLALTSTVICRSVAGERILPLDEFFVDAYTSALQTNEILTEVRVQVPPSGSGGAYIKLERKAGDFAIASAALAVQTGAKKEIADIGIGLAGVGLTPVKAVRTEIFLKGKEYSEDLAIQGGRILAEEITPFADLRGSEDYKREVAQVLFRRALKLAWERAQESPRETA